MGCWYSRFIEREETVARCNARKRFIKLVVQKRYAFSAAHTMYLRSLRSTGAALLQFAAAETNLYRPPPPPPLTTPPPPPMSPTSWTTTSGSTVNSSALPPPTTPPPPLETPSSWDFWDPGMPNSRRSVEEGEWEETTTDSEIAATATTRQRATATPSVVTVTGSSELAVVAATKSKDLVEIIRELDDYFAKASAAGAPLSLLLEVPANRQTNSVRDSGHFKSFMWTWGSRSPKWNAYGKLCEAPIGFGSNLGTSRGRGNVSHCSTVERLYAWEKKLYLEVKNAEYLKLEHDKKAATLRKLEMKSADYFKTEKAKKEAELLETQMLVASQAIESTSTEIVKLRETELYPQLVELVKGLMNMWRSMYEFHQVQTHIVQQLKYLNSVPSTDPTSEIHRQSTLQLELEAQQWHISFCNLMKAQRDYVQSLVCWLQVSLFKVGNNPHYKTRQDSAIYTLCEEWQLAINNAPEKVASEGIKSFLTMIHAIVVQQVQEQKLKKRSESAFRKLNKRADRLRSLESKYGAYSLPEGGDKDPVRVKVDALRTKAHDEKAKYEKSISVTRAMTMSNLQMGLPHLFQGMTGFANVCTQAFESVHNRVKATEEARNMKMILPRTVGNGGIISS